MRSSVPWVATAMFATVVAIGCGSEEGEPDDGEDGEVTDLRVPIPEPSDEFIDLVSPEFEIASGEEKMFCLYLDNDQGEFAIDLMEAYQGNYGHHIVLLSTLEEQPNGTIEDCTDASEMWKFRAFVLPDTSLPNGHGILIPDGMQYVMQIHYVNASPNPILVRDVARLRKIPIESVETWTTTVTTNSLRIDVPPGLPAVETFDCVVPEPVDLLLLGGHLHEQGQTFEIEVGASTEELQSFYLVDPWIPEYRDAPPVSLFFNNPMHLEAGTVIRTTCTWQNTLEHPVEFPEEMCAGFGYIAGTQTPLHCEPVTE